MNRRSRRRQNKSRKKKEMKRERRERERRMAREEPKMQDAQGICVFYLQGKCQKVADTHKWPKTHSKIIFLIFRKIVRTHTTCVLQWNWKCANSTCKDVVQKERVVRTCIVSSLVNFTTLEFLAPRVKTANSPTVLHYPMVSLVNRLDSLLLCLTCTTSFFTYSRQFSKQKLMESSKLSLTFCIE